MPHPLRNIALFGRFDDPTFNGLLAAQPGLHSFLCRNSHLTSSQITRLVQAGGAQGELACLPFSNLTVSDAKQLLSARRPRATLRSRIIASAENLGQLSVEDINPPKVTAACASWLLTTDTGRDMQHPLVRRASANVAMRWLISETAAGRTPPAELVADTIRRLCPSPSFYLAEDSVQYEQAWQLVWHRQDVADNLLGTQPLPIPLLRLVIEANRLPANQLDAAVEALRDVLSGGWTYNHASAAAGILNGRHAGDGATGRNLQQIAWRTRTNCTWWKLANTTARADSDWRASLAAIAGPIRGTSPLGLAAAAQLADSLRAADAVVRENEIVSIAAGLSAWSVLYNTLVAGTRLKPKAAAFRGGRKPQAKRLHEPAQQPIPAGLPAQKLTATHAQHASEQIVASCDGSVSRAEFVFSMFDRYTGSLQDLLDLARVAQ